MNYLNRKKVCLALSLFLSVQMFACQHQNSPLETNGSDYFPFSTSKNRTMDYLLTKLSVFNKNQKYMTSQIKSNQVDEDVILVGASNAIVKNNSDILSKNIGLYTQEYRKILNCFKTGLKMSLSFIDEGCLYNSAYNPILCFSLSKDSSNAPEIRRKLFSTNRSWYNKQTIEHFPMIEIRACLSTREVALKQVRKDLLTQFRMHGAFDFEHLDSMLKNINYEFYLAHFNNFGGPEVAGYPSINYYNRITAIYIGYYLGHKDGAGLSLEEFNEYMKYEFPKSEYDYTQSRFVKAGDPEYKRHEDNVSRRRLGFYLAKNKRVNSIKSLTLMLAQYNFKYAKNTWYTGLHSDGSITEELGNFLKNHNPYQYPENYKLSTKDKKKCLKKEKERIEWARQPGLGFPG